MNNSFVGLDFDVSRIAALVRDQSLENPKNVFVNSANIASMKAKEKQYVLLKFVL